MDSHLPARLFFGATALAALVGVAIDVASAPGNEASHFGSPQGRVLNVFMFFTIQSNILVALGCALLVVDLHRRSTAFAALRLTSLVGITVTGVVHHTLLAHLSDPTGMRLLADVLLHTVVPVAAVLGWLIFGPRRLVDTAAVWWSLAFPVGWGTVTAIRGPIVAWYPYPFIDVIDLGYAPALVNGVGIVAGYLSLAAALRLVDARLPNRTG